MSILYTLGRMIAELTVPGINLEFLKRPHDLALRLLVQDLCLVDRIQSFGPEFELVVCSSGKSLADLPHAPVKTTPTTTSSSSVREDLNDRKMTTANSSTELFDPTHINKAGLLLALSYTVLKPLSPKHPAMMEAEQEVCEGQEDKEEVAIDLENEAIIHRINVESTAIDAIGRYIL